MSPRAAPGRVVRAVAVCSALLLGTAAVAVAAPTGPDESPDPTASQLAESITIYDPSGSVEVRDLSGSVRSFDLSRSVSTVETETTDGDDTVVTLDSDILFEFGSADLSPEAGARIGELVADVRPGAAVSVTGHTDSIGDDAANVELSQRRAQAVAGAVGAARGDLVLDVQGRGETEPVAPNTSGGEDDPEGREQNRRVELRYTG